MIWLVIATLALTTLALKTAGPLLAGGHAPPEPVTRILDLLTPALLTALVVASTFGDGPSLVIDARLAGVAAGGMLLLLRAPLTVVLVAAAAVTAGVRAFGWTG